MRILILPDPSRPDRGAVLGSLAVGLRRLDQEVHVLDLGRAAVSARTVAGLALTAVTRGAVTVDAFATEPPRVDGLGGFVSLARTFALPRLRLDARGYDFVIAPADLPVSILPRRGQRAILLAGEIAPLPRLPAERWAKALGPHHELVFPTRPEWHRALAEAPRIAGCATRIVAHGDTAAGWSEDPVVHFARRVIGFTLSPSQPAPRLPAAHHVTVSRDATLIAA
ncbi:hypothetical protein [uncultured Alsobacter sp.]|uniref:hypothetical protein n=1 Tax=uncultured Alsobacter sp. TaxID=1748258 RepID=UPI0025E1AA62|nr:hypothetical protein [uncultured Alsobacter sp.]